MISILKIAIITSDHYPPEKNDTMTLRPQEQNYVHPYIRVFLMLGASATMFAIKSFRNQEGDNTNTSSNSRDLISQYSTVNRFHIYIHMVDTYEYNLNNN